MTFFSKFRNQILGLIVVGTIAPVLTVGLYSILSSNRTLVNLVSQDMKLEGEQSAEAINLFLDNIQADVIYLSETPPIQGIVRARENGGIDPSDGSTYESWFNRLNSIFSSFIKARGYYYQIRYLDEKGNELVRVNNSNNQIEIVSKSQLQNKSSSSYFTDTIHLGKGELYVSAINLNKEKGVIEKPIAPVIRYATPVYSKEGKQRGIIVANILVNELFELAKNEALEQKDNQKLFVVNQQGYYLNHPDQDKEWGFEYNKDETVKKDFPEKIVKQILSKENGLIEKGVKDIISYQTIFPDARSKSNPFVIVNQTPKSDILAPINQVKWVSILITIILAGGFVTLGVIILNQIVKTMSELAGVVSSFSSQVVSTVDEQESIASQQSSSVQETTATMEQLNASSQQSAQQAQIAVTKAQEAIKSVSKGNEAVEKTVEEMATVKFKVQQIAEQIQLLSDTSNQVINISDLVSDLANRTNMLALNAAVEAVRTGEHGKGFRVVATEIRKLADQSKQSGQKIHTLVEQINNAIQSTVHVTDDGKESVETSVKIAQNTAMVFTEVAEAMNQIVESSQEIALNYQQQATATQQVTETMSHIQNGAAETARGIGNMKTGTEQLNQAAVKLHDVI